MLIYLAKASITLAILWLFYKFLLEKESFYKLNRVYLLACIVLSFTIPLVTLPSLVKEQGYVATIFEESSTLANESEVVNMMQKPTGKLESFTVKTLEDDVINSAEPARATSTLKSKEKPIGYWLLLFYLVGVAILLSNTLIQVMTTILTIWRSEKKIYMKDAIIINSDEISDPCSFFNYVFINSSAYEHQTYEQILRHEKIHVRKRHSWDLILAELSIALMWMNPFIWLTRKSIEKNIEFQTDDLLVNNLPEQKESYQFNLLKIATISKPLQITTNYNQSLIKQRIVRMNKSKSTIFNVWKYVFIAPIVFILLLSMNKPSEADLVHSTSLDAAQEGVAQASKMTNEIDQHSQNPPVLASAKVSSSEISPDVTFAEGQVTDTDSQSSNGGIEDRSVNVENKAERNEDHKASSSLIFKSECNSLIRAIYTNDISSVRNMIDKVDVNCIDKNPDFEIVRVNKHEFKTRNARTALVAAARLGHFEIGILLIEKGAKIDFQAKGDGSPLMEAAKHGHVEFVKYLVERNADLNLKLLGEGTPLMAACKSQKLEIVKYLVHKGAGVDQKVLGDGTALIIASQIGHLEMVKYLVAQGALIDETVQGEGSALTAAVQGGHKHVVEFLLSQNADVKVHTPGNGNALIAAARNGNLEMVKYLIGKGAELDFASPGEGSALTVAVRSNHQELVEYLLSEGAEIDLTVPGEGSALTIAARDNNRDMVKYLLNNEANIDVTVPGEGTPLSLAARNGHLEMVKYLLSQDAEVDNYGPGESTPLGCAVRNGHYEIAEILLKNGADANFAPPGGDEAYYYAVKSNNKKMIKLLEGK